MFQCNIQRINRHNGFFFPGVHRFFKDRPGNDLLFGKMQFFQQGLKYPVFFFCIRDFNLSDSNHDIPFRHGFLQGSPLTMPTEDCSRRRCRRHPEAHR